MSSNNNLQEVRSCFRINCRKQVLENNIILFLINFIVFSKNYTSHDSVSEKNIFKVGYLNMDTCESYYIKILNQGLSHIDY